MIKYASSIYSIADESKSLPGVDLIQRLVNAHLPNDAPLTVDGHYGPLTKAAVRQFQMQAGIVSDGVTGPQTWGKLLGPICEQQGEMNIYALIVPITLIGPKGNATTKAKHLHDPLLVDTGAFEVLLPGPIAKTLGLPHEQTINISGVNSSTPAYTTHMSIVIGGKRFDNVHTCVDPKSADMLLGLRFACERGYEVRVGTRSAKLGYYYDLGGA